MSWDLHSRAVAGGMLVCTIFMATSCGLRDPITPPIPADRHILWSADHETGDLSQWEGFTGNDGGVFNTGTGEVSIQTNVRYNGQYAMQMTITNADGSLGNQACRVFRWKEAKERTEGYYSAWYYFPEVYKPIAFWNVFQFKSEPQGAPDSKSAWSLNVGNRPNGNMYIYLWDAIDEVSFMQSIKDIPVGQWFHIEAYYKRSATNEGRIAIWQDAVQLFDRGGEQTAFADNAYWSVNNYTSGIIPPIVTIYVDDAVISTARIGPGG